MKHTEYFNLAEAALDGKCPSTAGAPLEAWSKYKNSLPLVSPANRRKFKVIVVGSGLAGASAAASLGEQGYNVECFCFQDSPRRAHSIAAQGGINAAKNYQNDGDSVYRLFKETIKGGDFRAREANVARLAEESVNIIDQCVAQGVPFGREYSGYLDNRTFGGTQVSRTFYAKGQTGQQLLLGAYSSLSRQIKAGTVKMFTRTEMLDLVIVEGRARGIIVRNLVTGKISAHAADAVILATGGYGNVYFRSTNAKGSNVTATWRAHKKGAYFANPCYTQIHPTCIPATGSDYQSKLTLMSESLRNVGRVWVPKKKGDTRKPADIPEDERDYYLERKYPAFGNMVPRDIASRNGKYAYDEGRGIDGKEQVYLDFKDAIKRDGLENIKLKYGNLFDMYQRITNENPYETPMRIYPAIHYVMGGLWVDYNLQTSIPGCFCLGEANFSDHGANRLGASALMQGLADGYFVAPYTVAGYLGNFVGGKMPKVDADHPEFKKALAETQAATQKLLDVKGKRSVDDFHRDLGNKVWDLCGMERTEKGLKELIEYIRKLRKEFWTPGEGVSVVGTGEEFNTCLERAGRVADFLEFAELLALDALMREESCGGHFRAEHNDDGETKRDDENFSFVGAWQFNGVDAKPTLHKEPLLFPSFKESEMKRNYK
ncbi:MAG: hypothetical protein RL095_3524 [Verrucomicrobiota bacterium]|jgi:succinate dehydrogenase / fumarate reductase flavoprotein subunit